MTRAWVALHAWTLLPAASEAGIAVISPTDNGLVVGDSVRVVITGCKKAPKVEATLDGAAAPVTWKRLAHRGRWMAWLALHGRTKKTLNLSGRCGIFRLKRTIRFSNRITSSVQVAEHVVERFCSMNKPRRLAWHWGPGIFLYGLSRLAERSTRRDRYVAYLREYHAHHLEKGTPTIDWADKCPPALSGLTLATRHGDPLALPAVEKVAAFLRTVPKNSLGSIDHLGHGTFLSLFYPSSIWVDSLMMWGVLAVAHGKHAGDPRLLDFGLGQPLIFSRTARDVRNGLFHHAWNVERQRPQPANNAFWLRGNGWVMASVAEMVSRIPSSNRRYPELVSVLQRLAQDTLKWRQASGYWDTVMAEPGYAYEESSGSALVAYGYAVGARLGLLPRTYRDLARDTFGAIVARMRKRGAGYTMEEISRGTNPSGKLGYKMVLKDRNISYGVGAFLLLSHELAGEPF